MWKSNNSKMHGLSDIGPNVPAFLIKLWKLVNDPETDELICWSESNLSFIIHQPARFARELLSMYYKHNNMASFIRQLNMYGFHKIVSEAGGLKNDKDYMEFAHQCFIKDHPYLLENIKRKLPNPKSGVMSNEQFTDPNIKNGTQSEILAKVLTDVNNLKGKQESWDARLASMKRENEALWRELAIFRQKHLKQEQIINKLIHFIVTMVQPSRNVPLRRRYPLMLNDIQPVKKITKLSGADTSNISQGSPNGPTIHEIDTTDVLFGSPDQPDVSSNDAEYISHDLPENTTEVIKLEKTDTPPANVESDDDGTIIKGSEKIPDEWLEIEMTEGGDLIDPLTPVDPAKVNPAVAAATKQHLQGTNKVGTPITITIPSIVGSGDSNKKNVTNKIIYLTGKNIPQKVLKRKRPAISKLDLTKAGDQSRKGSLLELMLKGGKKSVKAYADPIVISGKQKIPLSNKTISSPVIADITSDNKAETKSFVPDLEVDDLEILLTAVRQPSGDVAESREGNAEEKDPSTDAFLKLDSLYNGTMCEDQFSVTSPKDSLDLNLSDSEKLGSLAEEDTTDLSPTNLVNTTDIAVKSNSGSGENGLQFEPESMAIVPQSPSSTDCLARELTSHVDSVQGELDYLKEMLKGEGYNFDPNSLPWLFNDDPLSYGVLPALDDESNQKKNEEAGISGNELMAYGTPNLMDLVDMIGSTPNNQDWTNLLSPTSPADLSTPAPSPSKFSFSTSAKRRKK